MFHFLARPLATLMYANERILKLVNANTRLICKHRLAPTFSFKLEVKPLCLLYKLFGFSIFDYFLYYKILFFKLLCILLKMKFEMISIFKSFFLSIFKIFKIKNKFTECVKLRAKFVELRLN